MRLAFVKSGLHYMSEMFEYHVPLLVAWASCQIRNIFPPPTLRIPLVTDPSMHHGTCVTHVPWCLSGSLSHVGGENVPGIPSQCAIFTYLARGLLVSSVTLPLWYLSEILAGNLCCVNRSQPSAPCCGTNHWRSTAKGCMYGPDTVKWVNKQT